MEIASHHKYYKNRQIVKLLSSEVIVFILSLLLAIYINNYLFILQTQSFLAILFVYIALAITSMALWGLYHSHINVSLPEQYLRCSCAMAVFLLLLNNFSYWYSGFGLGYAVWFESIILALILLFITRTVFNIFGKSDVPKSRTVILGTGNKALLLKNSLAQEQNLHTDIQGYINKPGDRERIPRENIINISVASSSVTNKGKNKNQLLEYCQEYNIDTVVVAVDDRRNNFPSVQLLECRQNGISIIELMDFFEQQLGRQQLNILDPSWVIYSNKLPNLKKYDVKKAYIDKLLALILVILALPILGIILVLLKLNLVLSNSLNKKSKSTSIGAKIIISDSYTGKYGEIFNKYSFNCINSSGNKTVMGLLLTKFKMTNLPLLFNILKGDLSFVGPEAVPEQLYNRLSDDIWYYKQKLTVKPGIISWGYNHTQYMLLNDENSVSMAKKQLEYDLFYIKNRTLWMDIILIMQKVIVNKLQVNNSICFIDNKYYFNVQNNI